MLRREFLKATLFSTVLMAGGFYKIPNVFAAEAQTTLLNIILSGGPDFRHLIVPAFDANPSSYGYAYWSHRWKSHNISNSESAWQSRYNTAYTTVNVNGNTFGVLNEASWLRDQFLAGNVAIVNNVYASKNRNHAHSMLKLETGDHNTSEQNLVRDGWGGRLANAVGGNVCSMTDQVRLFCNGPDADGFSHDNKNVVSAKNTRQMGLSYPQDLIDNPQSTRSQSVMARALRSYYQAKRDELDKSSPYFKFTAHEKAYREFSEMISARLEAHPVPTEIEALYTGNKTLNNRYFGRQLRNVYDCFLSSDILNFRVGSLEYTGWDSHRDQASMIEPKLEDLFGVNKGLHTLTSALNQNLPDAANNAVFMISGEFGRQLTANGDQGTDHGRGNSVFLIGPRVNGGVYGELFPAAEISKFDQPSADIEGLTSIKQVYAAICNWMQAGSAATI